MLQGTRQPFSLFSRRGHVSHWSKIKNRSSRNWLVVKYDHWLGLRFGFSFEGLLVLHILLIVMLAFILPLLGLGPCRSVVGRCCGGHPQKWVKQQGFRQWNLILWNQQRQYLLILMPWNLGVLSVSVLSPLSCWFLAFSAIIVLTSLRRLFRSKAILRKRTWRAGGEACIASLNWTHIQGHRSRSRSPDIIKLPNQLYTYDHQTSSQAKLEMVFRNCCEIMARFKKKRTTYSFLFKHNSPLSSEHWACLIDKLQIGSFGRFNARSAPVSPSLLCSWRRTHSRGWYKPSLPLTSSAKDSTIIM